MRGRKREWVEGASPDVRYGRTFLGWASGQASRARVMSPSSTVTLRWALTGSGLAHHQCKIVPTQVGMGGPIRGLQVVLCTGYMNMWSCLAGNVGKVRTNAVTVPRNACPVGHKLTLLQFPPRHGPSPSPSDNSSSRLSTHRYIVGEKKSCW
jgi:hypothetical protein